MQHIPIINLLSAGNRANMSLPERREEQDMEYKIAEMADVCEMESIGKERGYVQIHR